MTDQQPLLDALMADTDNNSTSNNNYEHGIVSPQSSTDSCASLAHRNPRVDEQVK